MRINLLKQLLNIHSPSRMEQGMVAFLSDYARDHGYRFETDLWNNVYLRKGKSGPVPAVCAHIDTVPTVGTGKLRQQRGRLFGVDGHGQLFEDSRWHLFVQHAFVQSGFTVRYLERLEAESCWIAHLTSTGCELPHDNSAARLQIVLVLASNHLQLDLETFGLIHRVDDKLVVAFQYAY